MCGLCYIIYLCQVAPPAQTGRAYVRTMLSEANHAGSSGPTGIFGDFRSSDIRLSHILQLTANVLKKLYPLYGYLLINGAYKLYYISTPDESRHIYFFDS